ncbi:hypothetical protein RND71_023164 [Anisodus tanguticus]|uniref:Uncharacterized protein n=1 Tax=Anisodus tanguticus TaxID=243964 RepID=A0AAE1RS46_9SOLA|nr:hypothetical protein RND71_023164 [Anisodus tanguticus]
MAEIVVCRIDKFTSRTSVPKWITELDESLARNCNGNFLAVDDDDDFCGDSTQKKIQIVNGGADASKSSPKIKSTSKEQRRSKEDRERKLGDITSKSSVHVNANVIDDFKDNLSSIQLDMFRDTCFGHFLEMKKVVVQNQLIHYLLLREVYQENDDELWVELNGVKSAFWVGGVSIGNGLNCSGDVLNRHDPNSDDQLIMRCFA